MNYDEELVRILDEKYNAEIRQVPAASYNSFIYSESIDSVSKLAAILVKNGIDFDFQYDEEDKDGTLTVGNIGVKKLKFALRKLIFDKEVSDAN